MADHLLSFLVLFCVAPNALSSPVTSRNGRPAGLPKLFDYIIDRAGPQSCELPEYFNSTEKLRGYTGKTTLLEDCDTLKMFSKMPKEEFSLNHGNPQSQYWFSCANIRICCPTKIEAIICWEGEKCEHEDDPEEPTYISLPDLETVVQQDVFYGYDNNSCSSFGECLPIDECGKEDLNYDNGEEIFAFPSICGFDSISKQFKFCCGPLGEPIATKKDVDATDDFHPQVHSTEDYVKECETWAEKYPESCTDERHPAFLLMSLACMKSCNIRQACVDELPDCTIWSRRQECVFSPIPMGLYCRKSCGVCGFRSPRSTTTQVIDGASYTNINDKSFQCGDLIRREGFFSDDSDDSDGSVDSSVRGDDIQEAEEECKFIDADKEIDEGVWSYNTFDETAQNADNPNCGTTIISDRLVLTAAHCVAFAFAINNKNEFENTPYFDNYDFRRVFIHPGFRSPKTYYDIAIVELSKRINYNMSYEHLTGTNYFTASPVCLPNDVKNMAGIEAEVIGTGNTECGSTVRQARIANMTIKENSECADGLVEEFKTHRINRIKIKKALPNGFNDQMLCAAGILVNTKTTQDGIKEIYTDVCRGDSGGPLYVFHQKQDKVRPMRGDRPETHYPVTGYTIEGIVSGGVGQCGKGRKDGTKEGVPRWFTRVAAYRDWIDCISDSVMEGKTKKATEKLCNWKFAARGDQFPEKNLLNFPQRS